MRWIICVNWDRAHIWYRWGDILSDENTEFFADTLEDDAQPGHRLVESLTED